MTDPHETRSPEADPRGRDELSRPKMLIHAQCGRRHYPTTDLAANCAEYRRAFNIPDGQKLIGRVHSQLVNTHPVDDGVPIETALESARELKEKGSKVGVPASAGLSSAPAASVGATDVGAEEPPKGGTPAEEPTP